MRHERERISLEHTKAVAAYEGALCERDAALAMVQELERKTADDPYYAERSRERALEKRLRQAESELDAMEETVRRAWQALDIHTYEKSGGKHISEHVAVVAAKLSRAEELATECLHHLNDEIGFAEQNCREGWTVHNDEALGYANEFTVPLRDKLRAYFASAAKESRAGIQVAKEADCKSVTPETPSVQFRPCPPDIELARPDARSGRQGTFPVDSASESSQGSAGNDCAVGSRTPAASSLTPTAAEQGLCGICGWALAKSREDGCVPGDCSNRQDGEGERRG